MQEELLKEIIEIRKCLDDINLMSTSKHSITISQQKIHQAYNKLICLETKLKNTKRENRYKFNGGKNGRN